MRLIQFATAIFMMIAGSALRAGPALDEEDRFALEIDAQRPGILVEKASELADFAFPDSKSTSDANDKCRMSSASRSIHEGAIKLLELRNELTRKKHALPDRALRIKWPAWVFEPPTQCPSAAEIKRRIDWLWAQVDLVTGAVCDEAKAKSGESQVCSTE